MSKGKTSTEIRGMGQSLPATSTLCRRACVCVCVCVYVCGRCFSTRNGGTLWDRCRHPLPGSKTSAIWMPSGASNKGQGPFGVSLGAH